MKVLNLTKQMQTSFLGREFPDGAGMKVCTIRPSDAEQLLETNLDNRNISNTKVQQYASDMAGGRWAMNGESIIIAKDGMLNDGQHRLWACLEAKVTFDAVVVYGVERETRTTVDQGKTRGAGDYLGMSGTKNANNIAAISRMMLAYQKTGHINRLGDFTNAETLEFARANATDLEDAYAVSHIAPKTFRSFASPTMIGAAAYMLRNKGDLALQYLTQIMTGENIAQGDPAYRVRERLAGFPKGSRSPRLEAVLRGWLAFRDGRQLQLIRITGDLPAL